MSEHLERLVGRHALAGSDPNHQELHLPAQLQEALDVALTEWCAEGKTARCWDQDASVWTGTDEASWLGWLTLVQEFFESDRGDEITGSWPELECEASAASESGASTDRDTSVVLLGMGGSSLGPEVLGASLACNRRLRVLDTTDPGQIRRVEQELDLDRTLFVVSSKSGGTLETNLLFDYFFDVMKEAHGADAGRRFVVITDKGSALESKAAQRGVSTCFWGKPSVGGRYSVLSNFGLVPAALVGIDVQRLMAAALPMVQACAASDAQNPGVLLGLTLALAAQQGRDKVTLMASQQIASFGGWVEQLLAESTGHGGVGLIPVDGEEPLPVATYGTDRLFVMLALADEEQDESDQDLRERAQQLREAGHPVVHIRVRSDYDIAQEFFRWQFATAVAGSRLGVNPFVQPDVEASKVSSRRLTDAFESSGQLPVETPFVEGNTAILYADAANQSALQRPGDGSVAEVIAAHLSRIQPADYVAILAYMDRSAELTELLQAMRGKIAQHLGVATCLGFGPRFLHSTGQAYKGGPNTGVFLQLTHRDSEDLAIPGRSVSFGVAKAAQARGDFEVLAERERRLLRVHFRGKLVAGLQRVDGLIGRALQTLDSD